MTTNFPRLVEAYLRTGDLAKRDAIGIALQQKYGRQGRLSTSTVQSEMETVFGVRGQPIKTETLNKSPEDILMELESNIVADLGVYSLVIAGPPLEFTKAVRIGPVRFVLPDELSTCAAFDDEEDETEVRKWYASSTASCFAEISVSGDGWTAIREAQAILREVWTTFYFCLHKYSGGRKWVGGSVSAWYRRDDGTQGSFGSGRREVRFDAFAPEDVERMRRRGFSHIEGVLSKDVDDRSDLESRLLKASAWWVISDVENHPGIAVVSSVTAMESVLLPDRPSEASRTLCQRVACITRNTPGDRADAFKRCRDVVNARHTVVHAGHREVEDGILGQAKELAFEVLSAAWDIVISGKFNSGEELATHLDAEIFKS